MPLDTPELGAPPAEWFYVASYLTRGTFVERRYRWVCACGHSGRGQVTDWQAWRLGMDHYYREGHHLPAGARQG